MNGTGFGLAQAAASPSAPARPGAPSAAAEPPVRIRIDAHLQERLPGPAGDERNPDAVLAPGGTYHLKIRIRTVGAGEGFALAGPLTVGVGWPSADVEIEPGTLTFAPDDFAAGAQRIDEIVLRVAETCAKDNVRLEIWYDAGWGEQGSVLTLWLRIDGDYERLPPELLEKCRVRLDETRDQRVAIVLVEPARPGQMRLRGFHALAGSFLSGDGIQQPSLSPGDLDPETPQNLDLLNEVRRFSRTGAHRFRRWLAGVLAAVERERETLSLIFVEYVETRVPWEMIDLGEYQPIGARALVVRWLPEIYAHERTLEPVPIARSGRVLAYLDYVESDDASAEVKALKQCVRESCKSLHDLHGYLSDMPPDVGLIFVSCHGIFAGEHHLSQVESFINPRDRVRALDLEGPPTLPKPRPIVFINACHSGRVSRRQRLLTGLPEVFLAKFADGFIGTLGPVDEKIADDVGGSLIGAARRAPGHLPEFLRGRRAEVATGLDRRSSDSRRRYVHTFMYVFYGSPRTSLSLDSEVGADGPEH